MKKKLFILGVVLIIASMLFSACGRDEAAKGGDDINGKAENGADHVHEHGEEIFEWSAVFQLYAGEYTLEFKDSEHDPSILIAVLLEIADEHELEHMAYHVMEHGGEEVPPGGHFTAKNQYAYDLILNPEGTTFTFEIEEDGKYVIFTEHFAWEFEMKISDSVGNEIVGENEKEYAEPHEH